MTLDDYLLGPGAAPWVWGTLDCTLFPCGWAVAATGRDPGTRFRGRYSTERGAHRLIRRAGGLDRLVDDEMLRVGFARTQTPDHGDIGVIHALAGTSAETASMRMLTAIRYADWWVARSVGLLVCGDFPMVAAWSLR